MPVFSQSTLKLSSNYETIGVNILLGCNDLDKNAQTECNDPEKDAFAELHYKLSSLNVWQKGFNLSRVDNKLNMCSGSIFWLSPNSTYDIKVLIIDSTTSSLNGQILQGTISTKAEPVFSNGTGNIYNVNPSGSGSFYTLQNAINIAQAGDIVLLDTGNYYVGNITFPNNGTKSNPIEIKGVNKENVILNGAYEKPLIWTPYGTNGVYQTTTPVKNPNLVIADGVRLYPHQTFLELRENKIILSYVPLREYPAEVGGFYRNSTMLPLINFGDPIAITPEKLYIKFLDNSDPNSKDISVTGNPFCLKFENNSNINVRNLTIKNYGFGPKTSAVDITNCNNIIIDSCNLIANNTGVKLNKNTSDILIQNCWFKDYFFNWNAWKIKATEDHPLFDVRFPENSRNLERGSIIYGNDFYGNNIVFRSNMIQDYHQGGHISPAPGVSVLDTMRKSLEIDFYDNTISNCRGDGFEIDGFARNVRVFRNTFKECHAPLSLAVAEEGPLYIFRNTFFNIITDISDNEGQLIQESGHPIKFQGGKNQKNGDIFFFHNSVDAQNIAYGMNVYQVTTQNAWKRIESKNNIFVTNTGTALNVRTLSGMPNFISDYNNYYSNKEDIACFNLNNMNIYCYKNLDNLFSMYGVEENSFQEEPKFFNPTNEDYHLSQNSPLIDQGLIIQGINELHYNGLKPDIGAFESSTSVSFPELLNNKIKIYPNPTSGLITIELEDNINSDYYLYDVSGKLIDKSEVLIKKTIDYSHLPNGIYFIKVLTNNNIYTNKIVKCK